MCHPDAASQIASDPNDHAWVVSEIVLAFFAVITITSLAGD
jgi:hypothetical protein